MGLGLKDLKTQMAFKLFKDGSQADHSMGLHWPVNGTSTRHKTFGRMI